MSNNSDSNQAIILASQFVFSMAAIIILSVILGRYIDEKFKTNPYGSVLLGVIGFVLGMIYQIKILTKKN